jgi:hypothetical protein
MSISLAPARRSPALGALIAASALALSCLVAVAAAPPASAASGCDVQVGSTCVGTGPLRFVSVKGTTCQLSTSAASWAAPGDSSYLAKTSTVFSGILDCPSRMNVMQGSLSAVDTITKTRYPSTPIPLTCPSGDPWLSDCSGEINANGSTGPIAPTVLDVDVSGVRLTLSDASDSWAVFPTPAEGATCLPSGPTITCDVTSKYETARDPAGSGSG